VPRVERGAHDLLAATELDGLLRIIVMKGSGNKGGVDGELVVRWHPQNAMRHPDNRRPPDPSEVWPGATVGALGRQMGMAPARSLFDVEPVVARGVPMADGLAFVWLTSLPKEQRRRNALGVGD